MNSVNWPALNVLLCEALKVQQKQVFCMCDGQECRANCRADVPRYPDLIADMSRLLKLVAARGMFPHIRRSTAWANSWYVKITYGERGHVEWETAPEPGQALAVAAAAALGLEVPRG